MGTATTRRSRTVAGVIVSVLGVFAAARASPTEVIGAALEWDAHPAPRLDLLRAPPSGRSGPKSPVALLRTQPMPSRTNEFYEGYLARRMSALFSDEKQVTAAELANPASRPWTKDAATAQHFENLGIRAIGDSLQRYAVERLGIDRWSLPLTGRSRGAGGVDEAPRVRFRLGFSHLAPRVDLLIPATAGRVAVSADARGRIGTTFEPISSTLRVAAEVDVRERTATVGMSVRF